MMENRNMLSVNQIAAQITFRICFVTQSPATTPDLPIFGWSILNWLNFEKNFGGWLMTHVTSFWASNLNYLDHLLLQLVCELPQQLQALPRCECHVEKGQFESYSATVKENKNVNMYCGDLRKKNSEYTQPSTCNASISHISKDRMQINCSRDSLLDPQKAWMQEYILTVLGPFPHLR